MRVDPIKTSKPTNADLARGFNQLHICHEDTKTKVETILSGLGLDEGGKPTLATSSRMASFWRSAGSVVVGGTGLVFVVKVAVIGGPFVWAAIVAFYHAIASGRL